MAVFEGSAVALVLPMFEDGSLDFEGFKRQVQRMIDGGVQALLVNGTTGETATITIEEEFELTKIVMEMAKGTGIKVIAGAGSNDTATALKKAVLPSGEFISKSLSKISNENRNPFLALLIRSSNAS